MSEEKRNHSRLKVCVPVELQPATGSPIRGKTADLSVTGFYIEMMFTLSLGTQVDIKLQVGDSTLLAARRGCHLRQNSRQWNSVYKNAA